MFKEQLTLYVFEGERKCSFSLPCFFFFLPASPVRDKILATNAPPSLPDDAAPRRTMAGDFPDATFTAEESIISSRDFRPLRTCVHLRKTS